MDIREALVKYWGYPDFRPGQEDIIRSVLDGKDTLALMPTGGGKSITYQVPAMARPGVCIVISPLIALMKDQVDRLKKMNIKAFAIFSGMHYNEIELALNSVMHGEGKFLYVSPERLATPMFREALRHIPVNLLAIDEAHCISQWGYDFRPPYLRIAEVRQIIPDVPLLAVTASATPEVVDDIQQKLLFKTKNVIRQSFQRENLSYNVLEEESKNEKVLEILQKMRGSAIVYAGSRRRTYELAQMLNKRGITADYYHAGLDSQQRQQRQNRWMSGAVRIMVATNAFGLGIDKPDVRLVIHVDLPASVEAYFQEAGRAGRDGATAHAVMLWQQSDILDAEKQFESAFPPLEEIRNVYQALGNYLKLAIGSGLNMGFDFDIADFSRQYNFVPLIAYNAMRFLEKEGYLILSEGLHFPARIHVRLQGDDLYRFRVAHSALDGFLTTILRLYTGLFSEYVKININELARKTGLTAEQTMKLLQQLHAHEVITFVPLKSKPQIIFTIGRMDAKDLYISPENYKLRRITARQRLNALTAFVKNTATCRSVFLLGYFGQRNTSLCGRCDVCRKRNRPALNQAELDAAVQQIKSLLQKQPYPPEELVKRVRNLNNEKLLQVLDWLLDNDAIHYDQQNCLCWGDAE
ncbi:MAG: RecQ family ATP-dependent DNA helicase [Bacteroidales bacterium]|jgi:ATP-dependent DNA helicase RecQ|nr:RecQ family ATP-dependent DNA helicase [Bacteroidales bacterium]MDD4177327.1 RecQ family ATP-dependent DNA helicase [Bacteroidales bacterium]